MLGYDLNIACAEFQGNRLRIDREINEKHALQIYQNECGPGYSVRINGIGISELTALDSLAATLANLSLFTL